MRIFTLIGLFFSLLAFAPPSSVEQQIADLKRDIRALQDALADTHTDAEVSHYFESLFADPKQLQTVLMTSADYPFKFFLIDRIVNWITIGPLPNSSLKPVDYILAYLRAFRDKSNPRFRDAAFFKFKTKLVPFILADERLLASVRGSIRNFVSGSNERVWAAPASILLESNDVAAERLSAVRTDTDPFVRLVCLEAVQSDHEKRGNWVVQVAVVPYLRDANRRVRNAAANAITDENTPTTDRGTLDARVVNDVSALLVPSAKQDQIITACTVLERNFGRTFYSSSADELLVPTLTKLTALLGNLDTSRITVRRAATQTLAAIKPSHKETQQKLARTAFVDPDPETARMAFEALGINARNTTEHRIRSESIKLYIAQMIQKIYSERRDSSKQRRQWGSDLLAKSQIGSIKTFTEVFKAYRATLGLEEAPDVSTRANLLSAMMNTTKLAFTPGEAVDEARELFGLVTPNEPAEIIPLFTKIIADKIIFDPAVILELLNHTTPLVREMVLTAASSFQKEEIQRLFTLTNSDAVFVRLLEDEAVAIRWIALLVAKDCIIPSSCVRTYTTLAISLRSSNQTLCTRSAQFFARLAEVRGRAKYLPLQDDGFASAFVAAGSDQSAATPVGIAAVRQLVENLRGGPLRCAAQVAREFHERLRN